jgi:hypothetical protein
VTPDTGHYLDMANRVFQITPHSPLLWRNPHTAQFGFDPPLVVLDSVPDDLLPLLHHLMTGVSEGGFGMFAKAEGVSPERAEDLLRKLQPVLVRTETITPTPFVLDGPNNLVTMCSPILRDLGHPISLASTQRDSATVMPVGEVILLAHYVPHPDQFHRWLRRDRPHTPVVFTDQAVTIGPRIIPGVTPCLHCELTSRTEQPETMTVIASQLLGKVSPVATPEFVRLATWHAHQMITQTSANTRVRVVFTTGQVVIDDAPVTMGCGCLGW